MALKNDEVAMNFLRDFSSFIKMIRHCVWVMNNYVMSIMCEMRNDKENEI
jgi:hypothetical protein